MFFNRSRPSGPFSEMSTMRTSGFDGSQHVHRAHGFFGFAANQQIGFLIDQQRQALAHDRMIVHHQDPAFSRRRLVLRFVADARSSVFILHCLVDLS